jgi:hypothetical protein
VQPVLEDEVKELICLLGAQTITGDGHLTG